MQTNRKILFITFTISIFLVSCASDRLGMGFRFYQRGEYKAAERNLLVNLSRNPERIEKATTFFYLGLVCMEQKKDSEAIQYYTQAIELEPDLYGAYFNRGTLYMLEQKFTEALADFTSAEKATDNLSLLKKKIDAKTMQNFSFDKEIILIYQAMVDIKIKNYEQADSLFKRLTKEWSNDPYLLLWIAEAYLTESSIENLPEALRLCRFVFAKTNHKEKLSDRDVGIYAKSLALNKLSFDEIWIYDSNGKYTQQETLHQETLDDFFERWFRQQQKRKLGNVRME